jgi:ribosomal protein L19E
VATVEPYTPLTYENLVTPEKKQQLLEMVKLARDTEQAYVENPRSGSANIYIDGARVLCLPKAVIKKMIKEMINEGVIETRKHGRSEAALAVKGVK